MQPNARNTAQATVLLLDGSAAYRQILTKMLAGSAAAPEVVDCATITQALASIASGRPDLIVTTENIADGSLEDLIAAPPLQTSPPGVICLVDKIPENGNAPAHVRYIEKQRGYLTRLPSLIAQTLAQPEAKNGSAGNMLDAGLEAAFTLDNQGKFLEADNGFTSMTGYSDDNLLKRSILDLLPRGQEWEFFEWLKAAEQGSLSSAFQTHFVGKFGSQTPVAIEIEKSRHARSDRYRCVARRKFGESTAEIAIQDARIEFDQLVENVWALINEDEIEPIPRLLAKLASLGCQYFNFQRATVALLDKHQGVYKKVAMVGYALQYEHERKHTGVPGDIIQKIFDQQHRIKVLYYQPEERDDEASFFRGMLERRSQLRPRDTDWHTRNVVLINLADRKMRSFGYISLDCPPEGFVPRSQLFRQLEVFSRLVSMRLLSHMRLTRLDQRQRRLNQVLVKADIFKLYYNLRDLLREVVWAIRFSLDYNVVGLLLINEKTRKAEIRAIASDSKAQQKKLVAMQIEVADLLASLNSNNRVGKAYLAKECEGSMAALEAELEQYRQEQAQTVSQQGGEILLQPIYSRSDKIIGALLLHDPRERIAPDEICLQTLEILSSQVSVAIENRVMYVDALRTDGEDAKPGGVKTSDKRDHQDLSGGFLGRLFGRK